MTTIFPLPLEVAVQEVWALMLVGLPKTVKVAEVVSEQVVVGLVTMA